MPQKACERGFCHVIAFSQFFEMPHFSSHVFYHMTKSSFTCLLGHFMIPRVYIGDGTRKLLKSKIYKTRTCNDGIVILSLMFIYFIAQKSWLVLNFFVVVYE